MRRARSLAATMCRRARWSLVLLIAILSWMTGARAQGGYDRLTIIAPAAPGGGWDQTARAMQRALEAEGLARTVVVENVPGAAGTIGLAQFVNNYRRDEQALLITGLVMVGAIVFNDSPASLLQTTPIARLTGEFEVVAVPASSPLADMHGLVERLRAQPGAVAWGGGSAGGTDHILAGLIAAAAGVDPRRVNYIAFSGGGEAVAALLGGQVTAGISGYSEFAPHITLGRLRAVAVSAPSRLDGIDVPTLRELGLDVSLSNWRAVVAPPAIDSDAVRRHTQTIERMKRGATWQQILRDRGWTDVYLAGEEFSRFVDEERAKVTRIARRLRSGSAPDTPVRDRGRLFPFVVLVGGLVVVVAFVLEVARKRGHSTSCKKLSVPVSWVSLLVVTAGFVLHLLLLRTAGFVIASTTLFWMVALGLGSRRRARDLTLAAGFSIAIYLAFTRGLGLPLPRGPFGSWMP